MSLLFPANCVRLLESSISLNHFIVFSSILLPSGVSYNFFLQELFGIPIEICLGSIQKLVAKANSLIVGDSFLLFDPEYK